MKLSGKEKQWCKNPIIDPFGMRRLGSEVLVLAIEDFRHPTEHSEPHSVLKEYFMSDKLELTIEKFCLDIEANAIRKKLGLKGRK